MRTARGHKPELFENASHRSGHSRMELAAKLGPQAKSDKGRAKEKLVPDNHCDSRKSAYVKKIVFPLDDLNTLAALFYRRLFLRSYTEINLERAQYQSRICSWNECSMEIGVVKWFNLNEGFGFIEPERGGQDVFVHISAVEQAGISALIEGQKVEYEPVVDKWSRKTWAESLEIRN